jgi:hypothetical protein
MTTVIEDVNRFTETFYFPLKDYVASGGYYTSDPITIFGLTPGAPVDVSSIFGQVDAGASGVSGTFSNSINVTASSSGSLTVAVRYGELSVDPTILNSVTLSVAGKSGLWSFTIKDNNTTTVLDLPDLVFAPKLDVDLGKEITSDEIVVSGFVPNVLYVFSTSPLGGINFSTSTIIGMFGNDMPFTPIDTTPLRIAVQISNSGNVGGTKVEIPITVRATINGKALIKTTSFYCVTKSTGSGLSNFYFDSVTGVQPNTLITSEIKEITGIQPNTTYTISTTFPYGEVNIGLTNNLPSGSFAKTKSIATVSSNPIYIAASVHSSSSYNTDFNIPLTLSDGTTVKTTNWLVKTMNQPGSTTGTGGTGGTTPITSYSSFPISNVVFTSQSDVVPNTNIISETVRVTGVPPNTDVRITTDRGLVNVGTTQLDTSFMAYPTVQSGSDGSFVMAVQLPSAGAGMSSSMSITFSVAGNYYNSSWSVISKAVPVIDGGGGIVTNFRSVSVTEFGFLSMGGIDPNINITSDTIQITNLPPNSIISITTDRGLINVGLTQLGTSFNNDPTIITSGAGIIVMAVQQPSAGYGQVASMNITITAGGTQYKTTWEVTSKNAPTDVLGPTQTEWVSSNNPTLPITFKHYNNKPRLTESGDSKQIRILKFNPALGKFIVFGDIWRVDTSVSVNQVKLGGVFYSMSDDGENWDSTEFIPGITDNGLVNILVCGDSSMVYLDKHHGLFYSTNGTSWDQSTTGGGIHHSMSIAYGAGVFISVGSNYDNRKLLVEKSSDGGKTWNSISLPSIESMDYPLIIFAKNQFLIYANEITFENGWGESVATMVTTSIDGSSWSPVTKVIFPTSNTCKDSYITYGNGKFISPVPGSYFSCSDDGKVWSAKRTIPGFTNIISNIDFINGNFFAFGFNNVGLKQHIFSTSINGTTWDVPAIVKGEFFDANTYFTKIAYGKNKYVTFNDYGYYNSSIPTPIVNTSPTTSLTTTQPTVLTTSQPSTLVTTQVVALAAAPPIALNLAPTSVLNTPILCSLSLAPFVGNELTSLKEQYAFSLGSNYKSLYSNAIGKYQFSITILKEFGYLKSDANNFANVNWTGNYGFRSRELFLDAPEHQELFFDKIMLKRYNELRAKSVDLTKFSTLTAGGMLLGAVRFGADAMINWLNQLPVTFVTT